MDDVSIFTGLFTHYYEAGKTLLKRKQISDALSCFQKAFDYLQKLQRLTEGDLHVAFASKEKTLTGIIAELERHLERQSKPAEEEPEEPLRTKIPNDILYARVETLYLPPDAKSDVRDMIRMLEFMAMRRARGLTVENSALPRIAFFGGARSEHLGLCELLADAYYSFDELETNRVTEIDVQELIARSDRVLDGCVKSIIDEAVGGVVLVHNLPLIREASELHAYSLLNGIFYGMDTYRDDIVFVITGEEEKLSNLILANEKLGVTVSSRITFCK